MKRKGSASKNKTIAYAFVSEYADGTLGCNMPHFLDAGYTAKPDFILWYEGERTYLCRITVERVKDTRGRNIVRRIRRTT